MLAVTKNKTLPFSKAYPNALKNGPKPLAKLPQLEGQRRLAAAFATRPRVSFYFQYSPSVQAVWELHALSPGRYALDCVQFLPAACARAYHAVPALWL